MARTLVLGCSLAIICLLAFLTISVAVEHGIDILVVVSHHRARAARDRRPGRAVHPAARWLGTGPPPLPPQTQSSRVAGRRSRAGRLLAILAILAAPVGVAAAALLSFGDGGGRGAPSPPLAVGSPPVAPAPEAPREPAPLIQGEPTPAVPLSGVDAFHVRLRRPPRAGLVFDVDTGDVLWRHRPLLVLPMASLTKIMTALLVGGAEPPERPGAHHEGGAELLGLGDRAAAARPARAARDAPQRAADRVRATTRR